MKYSAEPARVLSADCPWRFDDDLPGDRRGAAKHYRCLSVAELVAFPLPPIADDAWLFFWRVAALQAEALEVVHAWGFTVKAEIVWVKTTDDGQAIRIGMGRSVRNAHEVCLVCTRGRPARASADVPSVVFAPRGAHSAKPDKFYELIERLADGPRVELFARVRRPGWSCFGDELPAETRRAMPSPNTASSVSLRPLLALVELLLMPPPEESDADFDRHYVSGKEREQLEQRRRALLLDGFGNARPHRGLHEHTTIADVTLDIEDILAGGHKGHGPRSDTPARQRARELAERLVAHVFGFRSAKVKDVAPSALAAAKKREADARKAAETKRREKAAKQAKASKAAAQSPATAKKRAAPATSKPASKPAKPERGQWKLGDRCIGTVATAANCKPETPGSELVGKPGTICHLDADGVRGMVHFEGHKRQLGVTLSTLLRPSQKGVPAAKPAAANSGKRGKKTTASPPPNGRTDEADELWGDDAHV